MTTKKKAASGSSRKLKLKKETVKDLDPKGKANVKGGMVPGFKLTRTLLNCTFPGITCKC